MSNQILQNLKSVFKDWRYSLLGFVVGFFYFLVVIVFSNINLTIGNLGLNYFIVQSIVQFMIGILFMIFVPISVYKIVLFSDFSAKENASGVFGGAVAIIVAGCPACSITLASYVGLAGFFSTFPFYGLELKILTIPLMGWANYSLLSNLMACEIDLSNRRSIEVVEEEE